MAPEPPASRTRRTCGRHGEAPWSRCGRGDRPRQLLTSSRPGATLRGTSPGVNHVKGSVLIIENDPDTMELLSLLFEREQFTVYTAADGADGVALASLHKPDVIVCDLLMDRMDGFQVLQQVRGQAGGARPIVIVVSAKSYKPDIVRARELGADEYLVKPIDPGHLLAAVQRERQARAASAPKLGVKFWGTRGSIAAPGPATTAYGGNTSCVEVRAGSD